MVDVFGNFCKKNFDITLKPDQIEMFNVVSNYSFNILNMPRGAGTSTFLYLYTQYLQGTTLFLLPSLHCVKNMKVAFGLKTFDWRTTFKVDAINQVGCAEKATDLLIIDQSHNIADADFRTFFDITYRHIYRENHPKIIMAGSIYNPAPSHRFWFDLYIQVKSHIANEILDNREIINSI